MIELVDLRYRPEVNTIEALAESDSRKHAPLAEPIWTTTHEESGLGVGKTKLESLCCLNRGVLGGMALVLAFDVDRCGVVRGHESQTCGRSHNSMRHIMAKWITSTAYQGGMRAKAREMQEVITGSALWEWSPFDKSVS